jgi:Sulfotransferase family
VNAPPDVPDWAELSELEEYETLCRMRLDHAVDVREPLVLVSQIQRSGGTLLAQLLDGHPECHVDPYEVKIGHPKKWKWPPLDLRRPETWFETLCYPRIAERLRRTQLTKRPTAGRSVFPFLFLPRLQKAIFDRCVAAWAPETERAVLDCYFTSYFNAWLDNQNLYTGPKRAVAGFTPRLAMEPANVERFFAAYPDGMLITIVRDPRAWYVSAAAHMPGAYGDVEAALELWAGSADAALDAAARHAERVVLLTYEQLVQETEATMALVAERIGISMSPSLLEPTFNGQPIRANSSESVERFGVLPERVGAYRESLDAATAERILELAGDRYERAADAAARPAAVRG